MTGPELPALYVKEQILPCTDSQTGPEGPPFCCSGCFCGIWHPWLSRTRSFWWGPWILALIWTGAENLSVFISFLVVYPVIHINTLAGLSHADPGLLEMARVFRIPVWRQALSIYRISLYPYLESALKTSLGMGFKSGIAAEVIGVPGGSIGEGLYMAKIYLSTADLFAWTLMIIAVSSVFEKLFLLLLKTIAGNGVPGKEENHVASV